LPYSLPNLAGLIISEHTIIDIPITNPLVSGLTLSIDRDQGIEYKGLMNLPSVVYNIHRPTRGYPYGT
jgi:hypothetical protein